MLRREFVRRVSTEILTQLLEALVSDAILDDLEKESIIEENKSRANKARCFVDTVRKKGNKACRIMIKHLRKLDPVLFSELHRSSFVKKGTPAGIIRWLKKEIEVTDIKMKKLVTMDGGFHPNSSTLRLYAKAICQAEGKRPGNGEHQYRPRAQ